MVYLQVYLTKESRQTSVFPSGYQELKLPAAGIFRQYICRQTEFLLRVHRDQNGPEVLCKPFTVHNLFLSGHNTMGQMPHENQHTLYIRHPLLSALLATEETMSLPERNPKRAAKSKWHFFGDKTLKQSGSISGHLKSYYNNPDWYWETLYKKSTWYYYSGKKIIWSPADFVRLPIDKEMISL